MKTAKVINNGNSQDVRLPSEYRFEGDEVIVREMQGGGLLLLPKIITYERLRAICNKGSYIERSPQPNQEREF